MSLELLVALNATGSAEGMLFLDDGEQPLVGKDAIILSMTVTSKGSLNMSLRITVVHDDRVPGGSSWEVPRVNSVRVLGAFGRRGEVQLDPELTGAVAVYDPASRTLAIRGLDLPADVAQTLRWSLIAGDDGSTASGLPGLIFGIAVAVGLAIAALMYAMCECQYHSFQDESDTDGSDEESSSI
uniref:Uncharacterized protein n=1 Tax=Pyrodinium bahamense TaxID=73915 RepID=A0A7S0A2Q0_9DINO|mmetsp:Transcript_19533/g.53663  ORF Transcript_19533/g.53663 Transcript_19533/m.53663 type:complete len:184 (+) Transcript_19533:236-787(+)